MRTLQWHEPAAYRRAVYWQNERTRPLESVKFAAFVFVAVLGLRAMARTTPTAHPPPWGASVLLALGVALFAAYGVPAFLSLLPGSIVILSPKGVNNNVIGKGVRVTFWPWDRIAYAAVGVGSAGGRAYHLLTLHDARGGALATFALRDRPTVGEIEQYLRVYGKPLRRAPGM